MKKDMKQAIAVLFGAIALVAFATFVNVWIIHWAVNLFTPISMWQAFGISVLLTMVSSAFKGIRRDS